MSKNRNFVLIAMGIILISGFFFEGKEGGKVNAQEKIYEKIVDETKPESRAIALRLENDFIKILIDEKGYVFSILDKIKEIEYCTRATAMWELKMNKQRKIPTSVSLKGEEIEVQFENATAKFLLKNKNHYFTLELVSISPVESIDEITIASLNIKGLKNVAGTLNACYDESFAFCVMALNLPVQCAPSGSILVAKCYSRYGMKGNRVAVIGCPFNEFKNVIQEVETNEGLPNIKLSGAWGKNSQDVKRTYFFVHDLGEANCDRVIEIAKKMNAGMIMVLQSWSNHICGYFPMNTNLFPNGMDGLKAVVEKIHNAGLKAGLHFLSTGISVNDAYLTPVPDKRLFKDGTVTLAVDIGEIEREIPFLEFPKGFPAALNPKGPYWGNGLDIQIDDEIITYGARSDKEPYLFTNCVRGAYGTRASSHKQGAKIYHLMRSYNFFVTDLDTDLVDEVAKNLISIFDYCNFDMIYFDGAEKLQGDHWYYNAKLEMAYYNKISPERRNKILYQGSSHSHFSWHIISRSACADGYKDVKENVNNALKRYPWWLLNFMNLDIGWYGVGQPNISYSDVEYVLCRSMGWNSSCGFSTSLSALEANPKTQEMLDMIANYEKLRLANYFSEEVKEKLRKPGGYHLIQSMDGKWGFAKQEEKFINSIDGKENVWTVVNEDKNEQSILEIEIVAGKRVNPGLEYENKENLLIEEFEDLAPFEKGEDYQECVSGPGKDGLAKKGVTQKLELSKTEFKTGKSCLSYSATSSLLDNSGWSATGRKFFPPLDISFMKGIGLWVKGDSKGAFLKIQLRDSDGGWCDYYIKLDFQGWRYTELIEPSIGEVDKKKVECIIFYLNGVPANTTSTCLIDGMKALRETGREIITNPKIIIGEKALNFPVTLKEGDKIIFKSTGDCKFLDSDGKTRNIKPTAELPKLKSGTNEIIFSCGDKILTNEVILKLMRM